MIFTEQLWKHIEESIYAAILQHPFVEQLASGKLAEDSFIHYVLQDSLYLRDFGRGLAWLGAKAESSQEMTMFCQHARDTVIVEQALHESFIKHWNLSDAFITSILPSPTCDLYTNYLLRVAYERPYYEALGAFLPCYWIYERVGKHLVKQGSPNALYQKWIDTYAGEEFEESVQGILQAVNGQAAKLTERQREAVAKHFLYTSRLEWMFWDMGFRKEDWPLALNR